MQNEPWSLRPRVGRPWGWLATAVCATACLAAAPREGERVDLAEFGRMTREDGAVQVEWDTLREVREVRVTGVDAATAAGLSLQWWGSVWPANGTGGWMRLDDPWNGKWVAVPGAPAVEADGTAVFRMPALSKEEWEKALEAREYPGGQVPSYRRTLKVRVAAASGAVPVGAGLTVHGETVWRQGRFDIECRAAADGRSAGRVEVVNGRLLAVEPLPHAHRTAVEGCAWKADLPAGGTAGVRILLAWCDHRDLNSNDLTRVTVRPGPEPQATGFSFVPQDVMAVDAMRLPSLGAMVSESRHGRTMANDPGPGPSCWNRPVRLRLTERPEMTRAMAMQGIPRLDPPQWVPLGVPSGRQEFFVSPAGDWSIWGMSLHTRRGRDFERLVFRHAFDNRLADKFFALLDTREQPVFDGQDRQGLQRSLQEGYLPLIRVEWQTGPMHYEHALGTTVLAGDYADDVARRGDETVALLTRLTVTNTSGQKARAWVNLRFSHPEPLGIEPDGTIAIRSRDPARVPAGLTALRGIISMERPAGGGAAGWELRPGNDPECSQILSWSDELGSGESRVIHFKAPFVDLLDADELARLQAARFDEEMPRILAYWKRRLDHGMRIEVPDPAVNHFYLANLWHNVITTDRDPETGLYNQGVGTVRYAVFANETVMIARSMDMRGEHVEAERFIEPMIRYQGHQALTGRFSTREDVFHSAGDYTQGEYAMNHGFVLWGIADHYLMTRDEAYLRRTAPALVRGCDFLIRERASTMGPPNEPRRPEHGLAPACSLEDVIEFQYWLATNAYFHLGMKRAAQALAAIGHPEAPRLAAEAEAYRRDVETAAREAATRAAAVRLRDGFFVPYVPSRVHQWRHLTEGWIREALYPALHLATAEVVAPDDPLITWMLDELEDNIYFSWQSGYNIEDYERTWFERGGVTLQPCLVDSPTIYMAREEIPAALRAFWNTYALSIFPDVQCFAEWARRQGEPGGPLYKTSDESRFVMWLRELLIREEGDTLWLGRAAPGEWLQDGKVIRVERAVTKFGPMDLTLRSRVDSGWITATVRLPGRNPPDRVRRRLRHPHGCRPARVFVDGVQLPAERICGQDIDLTPESRGKGRVLEVRAAYAPR